VVDLDTGTVDVLRRHKAHQEYLAAELRIQPSQIVFPRQGGGWLSPNTLTRTVGQLGREAGCDNMSVRNLRHFHATVALQTGQNVVVISKRLGHSDVTMTYNTYAHVLPGWQKEAAEAFAQAMNETG
jgi:integrase